jgi:hypothetical protein
VEVLEGAVPAHVPLPDERRPVDRAERHRVAADVDRVLGVAGGDVELAGRLGDLLEHEVRVQEDRVVLDPLTGLGEQRQRAVAHELHADLAHQPAPALVEGRHRVLAEDLVPGHPVAEHLALLAASITASYTRLHIDFVADSGRGACATAASAAS